MRNAAAPAAVPRLPLVVAWTGGGLFAGSLLYGAYSYLVRFGPRAAPGGGARAVAADVLLFSVFAVHHSLFAREPVRGFVRRTVPPDLERSLYTWVASVLFAGVCWLWQPVGGTLYRLDGPLMAAAYGIQVAGLVLTALGARALDVLDLAGIRAAGGGPPPVPILRTTGVFGLVRHPLYFGWVLLVCGAPHMTATRAVFALVSSAYIALAIPWEERGLERTFGAEYGRYRRRVRWRMLPGLY